MFERESNSAAAEQLIRDAFDRGDLQTAASRIVTSYGEGILGFLCARLRSRSAGSDVFSDFAEDLWRGLPNFQWRSTARAWAYTLARNAANRYAVAPAHRPSRHGSLHASQLGEAVAGTREVTLMHLRTEAKSDVRRLREQLDPDDEALLVLRVDKGLSWKEIAAVMSDGETGDEAVLVREAARFRKRFQGVKEQLRGLAEAAGLITAEP